MNDKRDIIEFEDLFKEEIKQRKEIKKPDNKKPFGYAILIYVMIMYIFTSVVYLVASEIDALMVTYDENERVLETIAQNTHALTFMEIDTYLAYEDAYEDRVQIIETDGYVSDFYIIVNPYNGYSEAFFYETIEEVKVFKSSSYDQFVDIDESILYWDGETVQINIVLSDSQARPMGYAYEMTTILEGSQRGLSSFGLSMINFIVYIALIPGVIIVLRNELKQDYLDFRKERSSVIPNILLGYVYIILGNVISNFLSQFLSAQFNITPGEAVNQQVIVEALRSNGIVLIFVSAVIIGPIVEELIFRKAIFGLIHNDKVALGVSTFIFGAIHLLGEASITEALVNGVAYFVMGFVFGYIYLKNNRNIIVPIIVHVLSNLISVLGILFFL